MTTPLTDLSATKAIAAMRRGELSAEDYATALLDRESVVTEEDFIAARVARLPALRLAIFERLSHGRPQVDNTRAPLEYQ